MWTFLVFSDTMQTSQKEEPSSAQHQKKAPLQENQIMLQGVAMYQNKELKWSLLSPFCTLADQQQ